MNFALGPHAVCPVANQQSISLEDVVAKNKTSWKTGTVHWFDSRSGEGMIKSDDGALYYVHHSAIEEFANAKAERERALRENRKVKFQLLEDTTFTQISRVKEL